MKTHTALISALALFGLTAAAKADHGRVNIELGAAYAAPLVTVSAPTAFCPPAPTVVYAPAGNAYSRSNAFVTGHWEDVTTKTWVPGRWTLARDRWGRNIKVYENGYFAFRTERVWVENRPFTNGYHGWNR